MSVVCGKKQNKISSNGITFPKKWGLYLHQWYQGITVVTVLRVVGNENIKQKSYMTLQKVIQEA